MYIALAASERAGLYNVEEAQIQSNVAIQMKDGGKSATQKVRRKADLTYPCAS